MPELDILPELLRRSARTPAAAPGRRPAKHKLEIPPELEIQERQVAEKRTANAARENHVLSRDAVYTFALFLGSCAMSQLLLCVSCSFRAPTLPLEFMA